MRLKLLVAGALLGSLCFGAGYTLSLTKNYFGKNIDKSSIIYASVRNEIQKEDPEFLLGDDFELKMIGIDAKSRYCVFAYPSKPIAYSGKKFLFCFENGRSGKMIRI